MLTPTSSDFKLNVTKTKNISSFVVIHGLGIDGYLYKVSYRQIDTILTFVRQACSMNSTKKLFKTGEIEKSIIL